MPTPWDAVYKQVLQRFFQKQKVIPNSEFRSRLAYQLYPEDVTEVFSMSKDYPTLEENIQFIIKDLGLERLLRYAPPEEIAQSIDAKQWTKIAQAIPVEQEDALLRALLLKRLSPEKVESILRNDGKRKS